MADNTLNSNDLMLAQTYSWVCGCLLVFGCQYQCNQLPGKKLVSAVTCCVSSGMLNSTHSFAPVTTWRHSQYICCSLGVDVWFFEVWIFCNLGMMRAACLQHGQSFFL